MPASITIALVAFRPKVTGSRIEMPASGPMPGSTPTSVPTRQPTKAYQRLPGWKRDREAEHRLSEGGFHAMPALARSRTDAGFGQRRLAAPMPNTQQAMTGDAPMRVGGGAQRICLRSMTISSANISSDIVTMKPSV